ncbi:MAG TPA: head GIN domain-containing protein [Saprospiraceae bacterium]|nr:head GIN domain-containing protein [Saprospiraceae bacterium]HMQ82102.1 head GIN domain-containing protein [Saprospiraceae bacterium]
MKTITLKNGLLLAIFACLAYLAQAQEERKLDFFTSVSASGAVEVLLIPAESAKIVVYAENISPDEVSIFVKNETLKIQLLDRLFDGKRLAKVEVYYEQLNLIKASAGATVSTQGILSADSLTLRASSGAVMQVEVALNGLNAGAHEGAVITIKGQTAEQEVSVSTGGQYAGLDLNCQNTYVKASTGGQAAVIAMTRLDANANTGGAIEYKGDPEQKSTRSLWSGGIKQL